MEKIFKKSLALMVSAALCLTAFVGCLTVNAEETTATPEYTIAAENGTAGDTVTVNVDGTNLTSVCGQQVFINIPSALTIVSVKDADGNAYLNPDTVEQPGDAPDYNVIYGETVNQVRFADIINFDTLTTAEFHIVFELTIPEAAEVGATYEIAFDTATMFADIDENAIGITVTPATIAVQAAGPVLDTSLNSAFSSTILVSANLGISYTVILPSDYDDFRLVIERNTFDSSYNYTPATTVTFDKTNCDNSYAEWGYYYCDYTGIGMYELNVPVNAVLHAYKDGVEVAYSEIGSTTLAQLAKNNHDTTSKAVLKTMMADLLVMGTKAQVYFAKSGSDLENVAYPTDGFDTSNASTSYGELDNTSSSTGNLSIVLLMASAPSLNYTAVVDTSYAKEDLTFEISYHNNLLNTDVIQSVTCDNSLVDSSWAEYGYYYCDFEKIALYDSNKTVTARVIYKAGTEEETVLSTNTSSIESYIASNIATAKPAAADLFDAVAKFGVSARAYFPGA